MRYVAIISSAHKRVVDPFIQETYEKFKQFIPKGFEQLVKYDYCLEIPLYYESPEYYELIDILISIMKNRKSLCCIPLILKAN